MFYIEFSDTGYVTPDLKPFMRQARYAASQGYSKSRIVSINKESIFEYIRWDSVVIIVHLLLNITYLSRQT